jgi:murein DD-endopeptidase MepM/ murein hydrolase activator NlpD
LVAVLLSATGLYVATFKAAQDLRIPFVHEFVAMVMRDEVARNEQFTRANVDAMAVKLGEMQARLIRLDALGERISRLASIRPEEFDFTHLPGQGGADNGGRPLTMGEFQTEVERVSKGMERRSDFMDVIESELITARARRTLLPENTPVPEGFVGSGFGLRTDPITGHLSMHDGLDFPAPRGTPIFAAAGGVVSAVELNSSFGKTIAIDHDGHLSTLYAHLDRSYAKAGDIVRKGQRIASVGNTGRSTGPHLHFEVHVDGVPQNPTRFLAGHSAEPALTVARLQQDGARGAQPAAAGKSR